jgi:hypothetical protein
VNRHLTARIVGALLGAIALVGVATGSAAAHHSYGAAYDATSPVTVTGVISDLQWVNPHVLIGFEVPGTEVAPARVYLLDMPAPSRAQNVGLTREALQPGTPLTVVAWPSRTNDVDLAPSTITFDATGETVRIR